MIRLRGYGRTIDSMGTARIDQTATLLPSGQVLIAGGYNNTDGSLSSAELYDPASGTWTATGGMVDGRYSHTATLLPSGQVLVAGGYNNADRFLNSVELYDPASGTWTATGSMIDARFNHTATLLLSGQVLVAGGHNNFDGSLSSAELYDPASGTWTATDSMSIARSHHTAALMTSGKVLVAGGGKGTGRHMHLSSATLYDPATGRWTATDSMGTARSDHTATLLPSGRVLVAGGHNNFNGYLSNAELYGRGNR